MLWQFRIAQHTNAITVILLFSLNISRLPFLLALIWAENDRKFWLEMCEMFGMFVIWIVHYFLGFYGRSIDGYMY